MRSNVLILILMLVALAGCDTLGGLTEKADDVEDQAVTTFVEGIEHGCDPRRARTPEVMLERWGPDGVAAFQAFCDTLPEE